MKCFRLTAAAHAASVDRAWMPLKDCRAGILDTSTPSCASPSVMLKFDAWITSVFARAIPPTADKAPNTDQIGIIIIARRIDSRKKEAPTKANQACNPVNKQPQAKTRGWLLLKSSASMDLVEGP